MRENAAYVKPYSAIRIDHNFKKGGACLTLNPVLRNVRFRSTTEQYGSMCRVFDDTYLHRDDDVDGRDVTNRAYIMQHPVAMRSFATAAPCSNMFFPSPIVVDSPWPRRATIQLERPITVCDVLELLYQG